MIKNEMTQIEFRLKLQYLILERSSIEGERERGSFFWQGHTHLSLSYVAHKKSERMFVINKFVIKID